MNSPGRTLHFLNMKCDSHQALASDARVIASSCIPTKWGVFRALGFEREILNGTRRVETALALVLGDPSDGAPLVRIHSQCFTGEVLGSLRCDCAGQWEIAMEAIAKERRGLLIYEYQEGRGIGLMAKLKAYALQDMGLDTIEANEALGFAADYRDFSLPSAILHHLGVSRVRLLSNNPHKTHALGDAGIEVAAQIPCEAKPTPHSVAYLRTKKEKMGHTISLGARRDRREEAPFEIVKSEPPHVASYTNESDFEFACIEEAIGELRAGRMIVVVDDEDRENEGDLTMAAEMITPEAINFMAMHGRGLICLAMSGQPLDARDTTAMGPESRFLG